VIRAPVVFPRPQLARHLGESEDGVGTTEPENLESRAGEFFAKRLGVVASIHVLRVGGNPGKGLGIGSHEQFSGGLQDPPELIQCDDVSIFEWQVLEDVERNAEVEFGVAERK
jgi:hypothetical protein